MSTPQKQLSAHSRQLSGKYGSHIRIEKSDIFPLLNSQLIAHSSQLSFQHHIILLCEMIRMVFHLRLAESGDAQVLFAVGEFCR